MTALLSNPRLATGILPLAALGVVAGLCAPAAWAQPDPNAGDGYLTDGAELPVLTLNTPTCFPAQLWEHFPVIQRGVFDGANVPGIIQAGLNVSESTLLADVDDDGNLDVLWVFDNAGPGPNNGTYTWLGTGDGTFQTEAVRDTGSFTGGPIFPNYMPAGGASANESTFVADANGDGIVDIVWIWDGGVTANAGTWVWLGNGDGTFQHAPIEDHGHEGGRGFAFPAFGGYTGNESTHLVDVDNDGALDIVWVYDHNNANHPNNGTWVWLGNGDGTWAHDVIEAPGLLGGTGFNFSVAGGLTAFESTHLGDVDNDGFADLVWVWDGNVGPNSGVRWWKGNGDGTFQTAVNETLGFQGGPGLAWGAQGGQTVAETTRVVDVDRDGSLDILWTYDGIADPTLSGSYVYRGNGDGTFDPVPLRDVGGFGGVSSHPDILQSGITANESALVGDLNGDGMLDILWVWDAGGVSANSGTWAWLGKDTDGDGLADVVDTDDDGDGVPDASDSCTAPGSVTPDLQLWLKADAGMVVGGADTVDHWTDQSPAARDANLAIGDPQRIGGGVNFNPTVQFDGNDYFRFGKSPFANAFTAGEVFTVLKDLSPGVGEHGHTFDFGSSSRNSHYTWSNGAVYDGFGTNDRLGWQPVTGAIVDPKPGVTSITGPAVNTGGYHLYRVHSATNDWGVSLDGIAAAATSTNTVSFALAAGNEHVGAVSGHVFHGEIAEVILYDRALTPDERVQVESYLATKYGITLGHDYVSSEDTVYWDAAANATYHNDVAGIGRDDATGLHQKQSASINAQNFLAVGLGLIAEDNPSNPNAFDADDMFLVWGHDGTGVAARDPVDVPEPFDERLGRVWKAANTGGVSGVAVRFTLAPFIYDSGNAADYALLISNTPTFATATAVPGTLSAGAITFNGVTLANGQFFTLAVPLRPATTPTPEAPDFLHIQEGVGSFAWFNRGDGTFFAACQVAGPWPAYPPGIGDWVGSESVVYIDADGDGIEDVVHGLDVGSPGLRVYHGNGDGTFAMPPTLTPSTDLTPPDTWPAAFFGNSPTGRSFALDVTGDGVVDWLLGWRTPAIEGIAVWQGNGDGTIDGDPIFTGGVVLPAGWGDAFAGEDDARSNFLVDVTGDAVADWVASFDSLGAASGISVWPGNGDGTFQTLSIVTTGLDVPAPMTTGFAGGKVGPNRGAHSTFLADATGDGHVDWVHGQDGGIVAVWPGNGDGTFQTTPTTTEGLAPPPGWNTNTAGTADNQETYLRDVNNDGVLDWVSLVDVFGADSGIGVWPGNGNGTFDTTPVATAGFAPVFRTGTDGVQVSNLMAGLADLCAPDFGDAPASYGTLFADGGAHHTVPGYDSGGNTAPLMLGGLIDLETDGFPGPDADGDDQSNVDDEDGVVFPSLVSGQAAALDVTVTNTGPAAALNAWADWNGDGDFADAGEQIAANLGMTPGPNSVPVTVPQTAEGSIYFRFRLSTQSGLGPTGAAPDGEVEDYVVSVAPQADLAIAKSASQGTYVPGAPFTYTLVVTNNGPSNAAGFSVEDVVPAAIFGVNASCTPAGAASCGTDASSGNVVSFIGASVEAGAGNSLTITITGTVGVDTTGDLTNTGTVTPAPDQPDPDTGNNSSTVVSGQGAGEADLAIAKTDGQAGYIAGTPISYTVTVTNLGPSNASLVDVLDVVPAAITGVSASCVASGAATCGTDTSSGNTVSFTGGSLEAGAGNELVITIDGTIDPGFTDDDLVNTAEVQVPGGADYSDPDLGNNTATDTNTPLPQEVDLAITKDDGQDAYVPGAPISYTLTVTNAGPSTATGFRIEDAVPAEITDISASCTVIGQGDCGSDVSSGNSVAFDNATLAPGAGNRLVVTVEGTVSPDATGDLVNDATVVAAPDATETDPANDSDSDTDTQGDGLADLAISKTNGQAGYIAGTQVTYTITVTNDGPSHAPSFEVTDTVPLMIGGLTVSCTPTGAGSCGTDESSGNEVAFTGASLEAGAGNELVISITGTIDPGFFGGDIVNTAQVAVPDGLGYGDPELGNNSATDVDTPLPQQVDLTITKDDGQTEYVPGAPITYTLEVTNAGPSTATDVEIVDPLPTGITGVTASCVATGMAGCGTNASAGNAVSFTNATIAPGAGNSLTITIEGTVTPGTTGDLVNAAMVTEGNGAEETNPDDNTASDTDTQGAGVADLSVSKTDGKAVYTAGTEISYQIVVANAGPSHAVGFDVADAVPAEITDVAVSCTVTTGVGNCGTDNSSGNAVSFIGVSLNAGGKLTYIVDGTIDPSATGDLVNTAEALVPGGASFSDPDLGNNSATDTDTEGTQEVDLAITKDDGQSEYVPGTPVSYTVTVTNAGPSTATGVTVADAVPASILDLSVSCAVTGVGDCGSDASSGHDVLFVNASLEPGAGNELVYTIGGTVSPDASGDLVNTATVEAGAGADEANTADNSATDTDTRGTPEVDLAVAKTDGQSEYMPGTAISYTITVTNAGPSAASGFSFDDTVPAAITGVSVTCAVTGSGDCGTDASAGNSVSFTDLGLDPGAGNQLTFTVGGIIDPAASGDLVNTATVVAGPDETDTDPGNDSATDTDTQGTSEVDLGVTKDDGQSQYVPGAPISYTVVVSNAGPATALGFSLTDSVPAAITDVSVSCVVTGSGSCGVDGSSGNDIAFTDLALAPGAGNQLTFTIDGVLDPNAGGDLVNTVTVAAGAGSVDTNPGNDSATDTDTQGTSEVDLAVTKDDGQDEYVPGAPITYTVVVTNAGPSAATGFGLSDSVPLVIGDVVASCAVTGTGGCGSNDSSGNIVSFSGLSLDPGAGNQLTFTIGGTIAPDAAGDLVNTATVVPGGASDTNPDNDSATDTDVQGTALVDLGVTKDDGQTEYVAGTPITYTVTVTNAGPSAASGFSLADTVPAAITNVTASCVVAGTGACGTNTSTGNDVSFTGLSLGAGAGNELTFTIEGTIDSGASGNLSNTATVIAGTGSSDTNPANDSDTDVDTRGTGEADLGIVKDDGETEYVPGTAVVYTVTVTNSGPSDAPSVDVSDTVPPAITGVAVSCAASGTASCGTNESTGNVVSFTGASIGAGPGNELVITISGTVDPDATGDLVNTASVVVPDGANYVDPNLDNNTSTDTNAEGVAQVDLGVTKDDGQDAYVPGAPITYTLTVTNSGPSTATGFSIADTVPAAITGVSATCMVTGFGDCGSDASTGNNVQFDDAMLAPGAGNRLVVTVEGTVSPDASGDLANTATVTAGAGSEDTEPSNDSATDTDGEGAGEADLQITKTDGEAGYIAGTPVSYTLTVTNLGPSHAPSLDIADIVPPMITGVSVSCTASGAADCGTDESSGNQVAFTGASLDAGAGNELVITIDGTVDPGFIGGNIVNAAEVSVPDGAGYDDPELGNNTAMDTNTPLPQQVDLTITKDDGQSEYVPGAPVSYTLTVTNAGPSTASDVDIEDPVPAEITDVVVSCVATGVAACGSDESVGNAVSFTNATINPGAGNFLIITVNGVVSPDATGDLVNMAMVTEGNGADESNPNDNVTADTDTEGAGVADLSVTKTDGRAIYTPGTAITYQIRVANGGPSHADGFDVDDVVPAAITGVGVSCAVTTGGGDCGSDASSGNTVAFTGAVLEAGSILTVTVTGTIDPNATGDLVNTATATVPGGTDYGDPDLDNNTATDTDTQGVQEVDLAITKDDGQDTYVPGTPISYTLTVTNAGPSTATGFSVEDVVPMTIADVAATCAVTGTGNCGSNDSTGNDVAFNGMSLEPGGGNELVITISGTIDPDAIGDVINTATVTAGFGAEEANTGNNSATDLDIRATPEVDLAITKNDGQSEYVPGTAIAYTVTVTNAGPSAALAFSVEDTMPAAISGVSATCAVTGAGACGSNESSGNDVSFTGLRLDPGAGNQLTFTISGMIDPGASGDLVNTATVAPGPDSTDTNPDNDTATDTDGPGASQVDLAIAKVSDQTDYVPGTPITYTLTVTNAGPSDAVGVTVNDPVPTSIDSVEASCVATGSASCGTDGSSGNIVEFIDAAIAAGGGNGLTITITGVIDSGATGDLVNTATVSAGAGSIDVNPADNSATDTVAQGTGEADLAIDKDNGQDEYLPGDPVTYTVTVLNMGPSDASPIDVRDLVPSAITGVTATCVANGVASCGSNDSTGNDIQFNGASIVAGAGSSLVITIEGTIDEDFTDDLVNTARVLVPDGADYVDPQPVNNESTDTDTVVPPEILTPVALEVDPEPLMSLSDGNEVFEPDERVVVAPAWRNDGERTLGFSGTASDFTGPGPAEYDLVLDFAQYGTADPGEVTSCREQGGDVCYEMETLLLGAPRPAVHWDAEFLETLDDREETTKTWLLHIGDSFVDVPRQNPFYSFVERLVHVRGTVGCNGRLFCPGEPAPRQHMAVFVLRALEGRDYEPPACVAGEEMFDDVPASNIFCGFIEEAARRNITSGCDDDNYCPTDVVTRGQAAVLLLRTLEGPGYMPPACEGIFADVPCPSLFADWAEELFERGITSGCDTEPLKYCPAEPLTRSQAAVLVTKTFDLKLYGP